MYYLQEELARAHRSELLDQARQARRGRQLARAQADQRLGEAQDLGLGRRGGRARQVTWRGRRR